MLASSVGVGEVAVSVRHVGSLSQVDTGEQVGEAVGLSQVLDALDDVCAAKSQRLVQVGDLKVGAGSKVANEGSVHAETCEYDAVGDGGVQCGKSIGLGGSERVSNVDDALETGVVDVGHAAVAQHQGELAQSLNLEEGLELVASGSRIGCMG